MKCRAGRAALERPGQVGTSREVSAQQQIRVFVATTLPGTLRGRSVKLTSGSVYGKLQVVSPLSAWPWIFPGDTREISR